MVYKSKIDIVNIIERILFLFAIIGGLILAFNFYLNSYENGFLYQLIWALAFFLLGIFGWKGISPLFRCRYILQEDQLYIVSGKKETFIKYNRVLSVQKIKDIYRANTLALDKLHIEYRDDVSKKSIYVSPKDLDEFINQLKIRCKSMKIYK